MHTHNVIFQTSAPAQLQPPMLHPQNALVTLLKILCCVQTKLGAMAKTVFPIDSKWGTMGPLKLGSVQLFGCSSLCHAVALSHMFQPSDTQETSQIDVTDSEEKMNWLIRRVTFYM